MVKRVDSQENWFRERILSSVCKRSATCGRGGRFHEDRQFVVWKQTLYTCVSQCIQHLSIYDKGKCTCLQILTNIHTRTLVYRYIYIYRYKCKMQIQLLTQMQRCGFVGLDMDTEF